MGFLAGSIEKQAGGSMNHLQGLKRGDPAIYHRLGIDMHCEFLEFTRMSQHKVAVVWHEQDGKFLAPLSCITVSPKMERVM
ncbi:hypothetical protein ACRPHP_07185 [Pantoea allii]|uniref:hypothetical protein n=1 Tax=Pantoea allii TaxID=574096 RepID=UPI003D7AE16A